MFRTELSLSFYCYSVLSLLLCTFLCFFIFLIIYCKYFESGFEQNLLLLTNKQAGIG